MLRLWEQFKESSFTIKILFMAVIVGWIVTLGLVLVGAVFLWERPSQAQPSSPVLGLPAITLEPASGPINSSVFIYGENWTPSSTVLIYLTAADETDIPGYAVTSTVADEGGRFESLIVIPLDPRWEAPDSIRIIARTKDGQATALAFFSLLSDVVEPVETPEVPIEPTATLTPTVAPTAAPLEPTPTPTPVVPTPVPQPRTPSVTATANVNVRTGPGIDYPVVGALQIGQSADLTGVSPDGGWWQIKFTGVSNERGWVSARYVTAGTTANIPVVQPPPLPKPTAVVISDWRGEYFNNLTLSGTPIVRNDVSIDFDWGTGTPMAGIGADNFSVRWTRNLNFPAGAYRFYVRVDDGVRLWIDDRVIIDQWRDSPPTTYTADVSLTEGSHSLRLEYYEHTTTAMAQLDWEWLESYPDWRGEYFDNPSLNGKPVLVRNDPVLRFSWGPNSPGPGVPSDYFSARWTRTVYFPAGNYRFKALVDDGARLWIDDNLILDRWRIGEPKSYTGEVTLSEGQHRLRLEYFDHIYDAQVRLDWERVDHYPDWKAEYFNNRKLEGNPVLVRNETKIEHKWGSGSPGPAVPADNFSARWKRKADFEAGTYLFQVKVDDGVRLWLDDTMIVDDWRDGGTRTLETERQLSRGEHKLKVEYYERGGEARIEIKWKKRDESANQPPLANPGGPYSVLEGSEITFNGFGSRDADGTIVNYEWDFNYTDGVFTVDATGQTPGTRYPDGPATGTVALRVTDNLGASHMATTQVIVQNVPPMVEAGGPYTGAADGLITLAGTAVDPGLIDQPGLTYRWEFGDGNTGSGPVVSHSYAKAGTYTAQLIVTDKDGAQGSDTATVQVVGLVNQPPQAVIVAPETAQVGQSVPFDGSGSSDPDGKIVSYAWNFGDNTTAEGASVTHSYGQPGDYRVTLLVTDNGGQAARAERSIRVEEPANQPPQAVIAAPEAGQVGQTVPFDGSGSADPDGNIVSYTWAFGDGATGSGANVTHIYDTPGSYQVSLTVTDNRGLSGSAAYQLNVSAPPPTNLPPAPVIKAPSKAPVGQAIAFDGSDSRDSDGTIMAYAWDFGDGAAGSGSSTSHTFEVIGTYTVTLTVTDDGGLTALVPLTIQIEEPIPSELMPAGVERAE